MELIGVIGGMSWESTAEYLRLLNVGTRRRLGGLHSARLRVATVDFAPIAEMQSTGDWAGAAEVLAAEARSLEAAGASFLVIATNTMHKVYDDVAQAVAIPVLHLGDVTSHAVKKAGLRTVGLLATRYTMEQSFYRDRLSSNGVATVVPDDADRQVVQRIIYDELCTGKVLDSSRATAAPRRAFVGGGWSRGHRPWLHGARAEHQPRAPRGSRLPHDHPPLRGSARPRPRLGDADAPPRREPLQHLQGRRGGRAPPVHGREDAGGARQRPFDRHEQPGLELALGSDSGQH